MQIQKDLTTIFSKNVKQNWKNRYVIIFINAEYTFKF